MLAIFPYEFSKATAGIMTNLALDLILRKISCMVSTDSSISEPPTYGPALIADYVRRLPERPGVYRMYDQNSQPLYIGKAKSLRKRVAVYSQYKGHPIRIQRMIRATHSMEFVVSESEVEALLLEANLIKRLKPRYNILLRDDKSFPYILLRTDHDAAQIRKHRGARTHKGHYYGPFASAFAVDRTLESLQRAFRLRTCSDSVYAGRRRPCMLHQIKRCAAPCTGEISLADYQGLIHQAEAFLDGKSNDLRHALQADMAAASLTQNYEKAADLRDRLHALTQINAQSESHNVKGLDKADIIAIHSLDGQSCVQVFFYRNGQNWGHNAYFPRSNRQASAEQVLDAFIAQFYLNKPIPKIIYTHTTLPNQALLQNALTHRAGHNVTIIIPQRGTKKQLVRQACTNAENALARKLAETASQTQLLQDLARQFQLKAPPKRIEVYDNSHIQGQQAIGAFIVAGPEGFIRRDYRTFNIKDPMIVAGDDYAMMAEVFRRRFNRLRQSSFKIWPDLILIDGGKGQLSTVLEVLESLSLPHIPPLIAIAKGPDRHAGREVFYMPERKPFRLPPRTALLFYLQRLRDEAHRFAISVHRTQRKKQIYKNPLDSIAGIGASRKKALLSHFGAAKAVAAAAPEELVKVKGINQTLALTIHAHFQN